jgi:hypothetical protein
MDESTVELSVICDRGHFPVILIVPITLKELAKVGHITRKELKVVDQRIDKLANLSAFYEKNDKKN